MKTEFLKSLNLSQEVIDKIMAENGKDIAVEQKKAEKVIQERDSYKLKAESLETQVNDANTEIQKFKDMDIDGIKKAADDWKETAEKAKADADKQISQMKFDYALSAALTGAKAKNTKAVKALLDGERTESILQPDETVVPTSGRHFRGRKRKTGQDHAGTSW